MSLTSLLNSKAGRAAAACLGHLRPHLVVSSLHGLTWGSEPVLVPARADVHSLGLVGTAWDYWIRLWLLRRHGGTERKLVAEQALDLLEMIDPESWKQASSLVTEALQRRRAVVGDAIDALAEEVVRDAVLLASLDPVFRTQSRTQGIAAWEHPGEGLVRQASSEVRAMADLWLQHPNFLGSPTEPMWANPTFGWASHLVGGADADAVIGTNLWDFKTTTKLRYARMNWAQVAGYYALSVMGESPFSVSQVGLYFARFGTAVSIDVATLESCADMDGFVQGLIEAAQPQRLGGGSTPKLGRPPTSVSDWIALWEQRR